jgi:hypothetical protein
MESTRNEVYLSGMSYFDAQWKGFFETYRRSGWVVGTKVDIYEASHNDFGMIGQVVEVSADRAVVEVW